MNQDELEITKMLTVSTAHVAVDNPQMTRWLTEKGFKLADGEGWILHVPDEVPEMLRLLISLPRNADPMGLTGPLLLLASDNGCNYIRLDPDGPKILGWKCYPN